MALIRTSRFVNQLEPASIPPLSVIERNYDVNHVNYIRELNPYSDWFWVKTKMDPSFKIDRSVENKYYLVFCTYSISSNGNYYMNSAVKILSAPNPPFNSTEAESNE